MNESLVCGAIITIEELEELGQALTKYVRYMLSDKTLRKNRVEIQEMILEEVADVEICLAKFKKMLCVEECDLDIIKEYKESRLKQINK